MAVKTLTAKKNIQGSHKNVFIISFSESDDKHCKCPAVFSEADAMPASKINILPYFDFFIAEYAEFTNGSNPSAKVFPVSGKTGEGLDKWLS